MWMRLFHSKLKIWSLSDQDKLTCGVWSTHNRNLASLYACAHIHRGLTWHEKSAWARGLCDTWAVHGSVVTVNS